MSNSEKGKIMEPCMNKDFEQLPHTADLKIRVHGQTLEELFRNALIGMFQTIGPKTQNCRLEHERLVCDNLSEHHTINVSAGDRELLLVDFLSEALYLSDIHNQAYLDAEIHELGDTSIRATLHGINVDGFKIEIKAVTYHDLFVRQVHGAWRAEVVFDV